MNQYNTHTLRYDANFRQLIYEGVYWVPINRLGCPSLTNDEILKCATLSAEEKKKRVSCLYESVQLLQLGKFKSAEDNNIFDKDGVCWSVHVTGHDAVLRNSGCCATVANWLVFLLCDKYDEVGIISILSNTGNGHAVNYIKYQEKWYVLDLNALLYEHYMYVQPETGDIRDFRKNKIITAALFEVESLEAFTHFFSTYVGRSRRRKFLYCKHKSEITWEGYTRQSNECVVTYWPDNNTVVLGNPPSDFEICLLSALPV